MSSKPPVVRKTDECPESLPVDSGWSTIPPAEPEPNKAIGSTAHVPRVDLSGNRAQGRGDPASWKGESGAPQRLQAAGRAHGTLLGVAPPLAAPPRVPRAGNPIYVRAGDGAPDASPVSSAGPAAPPSGTAPIAARLQPALSKPAPLPAAEAASVFEPSSAKLPIAAASMPAERVMPPSPHISVAPIVPEMVAPVSIVSPVAARVIASSRASASPSFAAALASQVRLGSAEVPLWLPVAALFGTLSIIVAALAVMAMWPAHTAAAPAAQASVSAASSASPLAPVPQHVDLASLEAKPREALTAAEILTLDAAALEKTRQNAKRFRESLRRDPAVVKDKATLAELRRLIESPLTAAEALGAVAELPGAFGADVLYDVWTRTPGRTDATELARALVYSADVRAKASPALSFVLDLRAAQTCDQNLALLPRAIQEGDRRALHLLAKLKAKQGCGPGRREDCYSCLRDGEELDAALKSVKARPAPTVFSPP